MPGIELPEFADHGVQAVAVWVHEHVAALEARVAALEAAAAPAPDDKGTKGKKGDATQTA